jgi:hypothetical protein
MTAQLFDRIPANLFKRLPPKTHRCMRQRCSAFLPKRSAISSRFRATWR